MKRYVRELHGVRKRHVRAIRNCVGCRCVLTFGVALASGAKAGGRSGPKTSQKLCERLSKSLEDMETFLSDVWLADLVKNKVLVCVSQFHTYVDVTAIVWVNAIDDYFGKRERGEPLVRRDIDRLYLSEMFFEFWQSGRDLDAMSDVITSARDLYARLDGISFEERVTWACQPSSFQQTIQYLPFDFRVCPTFISIYASTPVVAPSGPTVQYMSHSESFRGESDGNVISQTVECELVDFLPVASSSSLALEKDDPPKFYILVRGESSGNEEEKDSVLELKDTREDDGNVDIEEIGDKDRASCDTAGDGHEDGGGGDSGGDEEDEEEEEDQEDEKSLKKARYSNDSSVESGSTGGSRRRFVYTEEDERDLLLYLHKSGKTHMSKTVWRDYLKSADRKITDVKSCNAFQQKLSRLLSKKNEEKCRKLVGDKIYDEITKRLE